MLHGVVRREIFFQAEDGIRGAHWWLEFRRVLFRSSLGKLLAGHAARHVASVTSRSTAASLLGQRRRTSEGLRRRCHSTPLVVKSGSKPQSAAPGDGLKSGLAAAGTVHNEAGSGGGLTS